MIQQEKLDAGHLRFKGLIISALFFTILYKLSILI